jgi:N-acylglucosamine-6-phosphate 2-epimerase
MPRTLFPGSLKSSLIVSCQAPPGDPLDDIETLACIARSVAQGGAGGLRANGMDCIAAFRRETARPALGIRKLRMGSEFSMARDFFSARAIAEADAHVVALDCSAARHVAAEPWPEFIVRIQFELGRPVLADIATCEEALAAEAASAAAIAATLYGLTPETAGARTVNWNKLENLARTLTISFLVEGHVSQPQELRRAFDIGALAVVVGSAITRPEFITA